MIIQRYLRQHIINTSAAFFIVLTSIILTNNLVRFLSRVAQGEFPLDTLIPLILLGSVQSLIVLVPIAFFLGGVWAFGILQQQRELIALCVAGVRPISYLVSIFQFAIPLALITALGSLFLGPYVYTQYEKLRQYAIEKAALEGLVETGHFREIPKQDIIIYAENLDRENRALKNLFLQYKNNVHIIETAEQAKLTFSQDGSIWLQFKNGHWYQGKPGEKAYTIIDFEEHEILLPIERTNKKVRLESLPSWQLWSSQDPERQAEWQWRLSIPISILVLAFLMLPVIQIRGQRQRYYNFGLALLLYIFYINMIVISKTLIEQEKLFLGIWWVHSIMLVGALVRIWRLNLSSLRFRQC